VAPNFLQQGSAGYELGLAVPVDPHRRCLAGLGATDEWRAPDRFDESLAWAPLGGLIGAFAVGVALRQQGRCGRVRRSDHYSHILMSLAIDHFGWFNLPPHPMNICGRRWHGAR
jgi:uncharacterized membrane protein YdcZ (DUF606 family)